MTHPTSVTEMPWVRELTVPVALRVWIALWVLVTLLTGCGAALESNRATRKFSSMYGCSDAQAKYAGGGWWVSGCGQRAHYTCFDTGEDDGLLSAMLFGSDTCVQDHHEGIPSKKPASNSSSRTSLARTLPRAGIHLTRHEQGYRTIRATARHGLVTVTLMAAPERDRDHLVWEVRVPEGSQDDADACIPEIYLDGNPLETSNHRFQATARTDRYLFASQAEVIEHAARPSRVLVAVCDTELVLNDSERDLLVQFAIRVREERNRSAAQAGRETGVGSTTAPAAGPVEGDDETAAAGPSQASEFAEPGGEPDA